MSKTVQPVTYLLQVIVGFHPEGVCCEGCRFCRTDTANRDRKRCAVTEEILWNTRQMGMLCPLVKEDERDETGIQVTPS